MPIGQSVAIVRNLLKGELKESLTIGTANDALYNQLIANCVNFYTTQYDWSHLRDRWDCVIGGRYNNFPTTDIQGNTGKSINFDRPVNAEVLYTLRYFQLQYGIGAAQYNWINSDLNQVSDPVQRWMRKDASTTVFEVWPVPTGANTVRFTGQYVTPAFSSPVADGDLVLIDSLLIAYTLAAELSTKRKALDAQVIAGKAATRFRTLQGSDPHVQTSYCIGGDDEAGVVRRPIAITLTHG